MENFSITKTFVSGIADLIPSVNDSPYKRIIVFGDIHGCFDKLTSLLDKVCLNEEDLAIFVGDFIDRGDNVADTLKWVIEQSKKKNFIFLRGNHEQMMLDTFHKRMNKLTWAFNGGMKTIQALSKLKSEDETFIERVLDFMENLPLYHSMTIGGREYVFAHAGIEAGIPLEEQNEDFLLWAREGFFNHYDGEAIVISGHSPVQAFKEFGVADNPRPVRLPGRNVVMIDTGSFIKGNGKISSIDILTYEYWQS